MDWTGSPSTDKKIYNDVDLFSLGGATEASIWSIYYPIRKVSPEWKSIPYGYPLANQTIYVLDIDKNLCPLGVKGDIYIGGIGLAKGYQGNAKMTKESFIEHIDFGRLYSTKDIGIMHRNGYIEFLGRNDTQVKIRGYRVELGEIEVAIRSIEGITDAVATVYKNKQGIDVVHAFYVSQSKIDTEYIIDYLLERLPPYMVPYAINKIDRIPVGGNQKVDKTKLLHLLGDATDMQLLYPRDEIESTLLKIWHDILEIDQISIEDNFFALGGDSVCLYKLRYAIEKYFGYHIPFVELLKVPSIKKQAIIIKNGRDMQYNAKFEKNE